jgi:hypothetical protein
MKIRFTPRAHENLDVISEYLRSKDLAGSRHVRAAIYDTLQSLIAFLDLGAFKRPRAIARS